MRAVTNTKLSDSRIIIRPKVINIENQKLPKYTANGLTFNGNLKINGSIVSGFSSSSYIGTNINASSLNSNSTYLFRVKFRQTSYESYFVNTMGNADIRINGLWGNGSVDFDPNRSSYVRISTGLNLSNYVNKWLILETKWDKTSGVVQVEFKDENETVITHNTASLTTNFNSQNVRIGIGENEYPAYNLEIDLLNTYILKDGINISPWVENVGGVNDFFVLTNGERIGETWIKFNESNSDGGSGSAHFNATGQNFQFNNIKVYVGRSERRLIWQALEQFYIDSSNVNITHSIIRFLIEGTEEVVRLHVWDTGGNLRVNNNLYNYYAFDDDTNTYWGNYWSSARPGMCIIFDKPLNITKLSFTGGTGLNDLVIRVNKQIYRSVSGYQGGDRSYTWNN